jgi:nucleotidyltransferase-like protein
MASALAGEIARDLAAVPGVVGVVLGGSQARGTADAASDVDLGLYYEPTAPPARDTLNALAATLDDRRPPDAVTGLGEWGPWINGGAWLVVRGTRVDWLFRDLARVRRVIADCRAGRPEIAYQPGHPHAFVSAIYLGELACCEPLADPDGVVAALRRTVESYPPLLGRALVARFLFEADFSLSCAEKSAARGDVAYVAGSLFRTVASLVQVLFAANRRYCINEKGALAATDGLARHPDGFAAAAAALLGAPGRTPDELAAGLRTAAGLVAAVRAAVA